MFEQLIFLSIVVRILVQTHTLAVVFNCSVHNRSRRIVSFKNRQSLSEFVADPGDYEQRSAWAEGDRVSKCQCYTADNNKRILESDNEFITCFVWSQV